MCFRLLVNKSVESCRLGNLMTVAEMERVETVLQSALMRFEAEDNFHISETQNKIKNLTSTTASLSNMAASVIAQNQPECMKSNGAAGGPGGAWIWNRRRYPPAPSNLPGLGALTPTSRVLGSYLKAILFFFGFEFLCACRSNHVVFL